MQAILSQLRSLSANQFVRNLCSMGGAQLSIRVSRLITTVILARLLSPNDYGLAAIVLTVYELVALFTRNGISAKVVQATDAEVGNVAQTAYTMTWIVCASLTLTQLLLAIPIAVAFNDMRLAPPIALMGLIYLATPLCNIQSAFIQREGKLGRIAATSAIQVITDNFLTAGLAALDFGMWAIILPKLLVAPIWVIGLRTGHNWRPSAGWSLLGWRDIARFSRSIIGIEALTTFQANVDYLIVGSVLGVEALGLYYFAFNAGLGITLGLTSTFGAALFPHLCALRGDPAQLASNFRRSRMIMGGIITSVILMQVFLAPFYVPMILGDRWTPAIPVLMLICLSALPRPFAVACSQLLKALGRPDVELRWQAALTLVLVFGLFLGTYMGVLGVAVAVLVVQGGMLTAFAIIVPRGLLVAPVTAVSRLNPEITFEVVTDTERFLALQPEWNALWSRANAPYVSQSFAWCLAGWRTTSAPRGRKLFIVVGRHSGRVVLIWPMTVRRRLSCSIGAALGAESTEYDPTLIENGPAAGHFAQQAWNFLRRHPELDVVNIPFVRHGSLTHSVLDRMPTHREERTLPTPYIQFAADESWDGYWRTRSSNLRNGLKRRRRRLEERGSVTVRFVEDKTEFDCLLDWTLCQKRTWMKNNRLSNDFINMPEYREFLGAMRGSSTATGGLVMMVLRVGEQPVAVKIGCIDGTRFEGFITTYDPSWSEYSPGQIILAECLAWCQVRGLMYDFRIGDEQYKHDWSTGCHQVTSYKLAMTLRGTVIIKGDIWVEFARSAIDRLRLITPVKWRVQIKSWASLLTVRKVQQGF